MLKIAFLSILFGFVVMQIAPTYTMPLVVIFFFAVYAAYACKGGMK